MVQIVICIYTMLNIYTVKQKSLGYIFLLCIKMQNQVHDFFVNFLLIFYLLGK
jgi:hypothetical protein